MQVQNPLTIHFFKKEVGRFSVIGFRVVNDLPSFVELVNSWKMKIRHLMKSLLGKERVYKRSQRERVRRPNVHPISSYMQ